MGCGIRELEDRASLLRRDVMEMTTEAGSGHPGGSLSSADLMAALYFKVMSHDPSDPEWADRDRFVMSKGHAAPVLYAALAGAGYLPREELQTLRKIGSRLQGHPVRGKVPGVEMSTGSLGQGLSMACGIALAAKIDGRGCRTFCLLGDGELQSGQNWEAAMFARHHRLNRLTAFVDRNGLQINGSTEDNMSLDPLPEKWRAFGWNVIIIDGHDMAQILEACRKSGMSENNPTVVIMHTVKGRGVSFMEGKAEYHGKVCSREECEKAVAEIGRRRI